MRQINLIAKAVGAPIRAFRRRQSIYCTRLGHLLLLSGYQCVRPAPLSGASDPTGAEMF